MQRNTSVADRLSVRATGPPDSVKRLDLRLQRPLLRETLKMAEPPRQGLLAVAMRQPQATPFELLQASLPVKTKQLIAVAVAHVTQCPYCIRGHTQLALKNGASHEEIMEAIWVAAEMRAGAAYAHSNLALDVMTTAT